MGDAAAKVSTCMKCGSERLRFEQVRVLEEGQGYANIVVCLDCVERLASGAHDVRCCPCCRCSTVSTTTKGSLFGGCDPNVKTCTQCGYRWRQV